jgi:hypothetical protein
VSSLVFIAACGGAIAVGEEDGGTGGGTGTGGGSGGGMGNGVLDAGMGEPDAGPAPTVCTSGSMWTSGNLGSSNMNPGQACVTCHKTQKPSRAYYFMGTAYPTAHEQTNCNAAPPSGIVVEIIDANGNTALTLPVRSPSGNFFSTSTSAGIALPYRARIRNAQGATLEMTTPQMNGDCNSCHTEQGANGAPGRIVWPQ